MRILVVTCFIEFIIYDNKCPLERDTAGQERFAPIGSMYYQGAKAVIFTYDITKVILLIFAVKHLNTI